MTGMIRLQVSYDTYTFTRSPDMNSGSFCGAVGPMRGQGWGLEGAKRQLLVRGRSLTSNGGKSLTSNGCDFHCISEATE